MSRVDVEDVEDIIDQPPPGHECSSPNPASLALGRSNGPPDSHATPPCTLPTRGETAGDRHGHHSDVSGESRDEHAPPGSTVDAQTGINHNIRYKTKGKHLKNKIKEGSNTVVRPKRKTSQPDRFGCPISLEGMFSVTIKEYCYGVSSVPRHFTEAIKCSDSDKWWEAMTDEFNSLNNYKTFELVDIPKDTKIIPGMWVYNIKREVDGSTRHKARWVAKGYAQTYGINYSETYAPMSRMTTIRAMMFFCVQMGFLAHQLDVSTAYLNAHLDHTIYMTPPQCFCQDKTKVARLRKSLYGLKQSAKLWNDTLHSFLMRIKFKRSRADLCLYTKVEPHGLT
ncbi:unnamed protein product, partial [Meganyctiphanes norvegica]